MPVGPLRFDDGALELLDQTLLPGEERWLRCERPEQVADAIRRLAVRGAPAIGVACAYGLALAPDFEEAAALLGATRPTAVNLHWAIEHGRAVHESGGSLLEWARDVERAQLEADRRIADYAAALLSPGSRVYTHCNAGALATAGLGTAGGAIEAAFGEGLVAHVWVGETRPLNQGARLTAWELRRAGVPFHVVTDSSAGALMARGMVDAVMVGADRVAANGDVANKIGTYSLAVLADRHGVPFHVVAPLSTIDPATPSGAEIPIEERDPGEVVAGLPALNYAFDVTPHGLVSSIVTEAGVLSPPFTEL
ncbi:MAG TPA: S-methyl-5-thioribose-1-phosphate isomerase [Thermoleophilaceae bacterium]|jgi:methylthioribose-1-phosphate isomerase|nr:S-methyl-5-thioribose-1-phosphate isomerase [Thermoleophilaceae bacterium]